MENTQNNIEGNSSDSKKTVWFTVVAGVLVLGALVWWLRGTQFSQQAVSSPTPDSETITINQDVDGISVGDLNAEFQAIDADLQGL